MFIVDGVHNVAADAIAGEFDFISIHTAFSRTGASEASGGTYARVAAAWNAAANSEATANGDKSVNVPSGTYKYVGYYSLATAGVFKGMFPIGSAGALKCYAVASTDTFHSEAHGFVNDQKVVFFGDALPTGITEATEYFVVGAATDTFQVSTTQGGAAVDITDEGFAVVSKIVAETFGSDGQIVVKGTTSKISLLGLRN